MGTSLLRSRKIACWMDTIGWHQSKIHRHPLTSAMPPSSQFPSQRQGTWSKFAVHTAPADIKPVDEQKRSMVRKADSVGTEKENLI